jgi:serine/threonine protein kinase
MAKLKSYHVVQFKDCWIENNVKLYIQMELCFDTLKGVLKQKQNEFERNEFELLNEIEYFISSELFIELLECVNYLHKQKPSIIHRDLKPSNILITDGKNRRFVKLGDLGLATDHFDGQTHSEAVGTTKFIAPEVFRGRDYDTKADIYSLGYIAQDLFAIDINE